MCSGTCPSNLRIKNNESENTMQQEDIYPQGTSTPPQKVTVEELDLLVSDIFTKKKEIEASELVTSGLNKELAVLKGRAVNYLTELGREDFKSPYGNVSISQKWRINMPATDEDKAALFDWMRERQIFDRYATVNSNSLNSLYMAEWEDAKKRGEGMTFSMPGIGEPKLFTDLGMRKK